MTLEDHWAESYAYRFNFRPLVWPTAFFLVCTVILIGRAQYRDDLESWLLVAVSGAFVAIPVLIALVTKLFPRTLVFGADSLTVPARGLSRGTRTVRYTDIVAVWVSEVHGQRFLCINDGEDLYIPGSMLEPRVSLETLGGRIAEGAGVVFIRSGPLAARPNIWRIPALKVTALLSFCGGPLWVTDQLKPVLGDPWNFVVGFAPIAVFAFAALTAMDDEPSGASRVIVTIGAAGAVVMLLEGLVAIAWTFGADAPGNGLLFFGTASGLVATALYARISAPHLR